MSDLLSAGDWQEFRGAIQDVTDTFFNIPITYSRVIKHHSNWNENKENNSTKTDIILKGLSIYDKTGVSALNDRGEIGSMDLSEGYLYFNWWDLELLGLINPTTKEPVFNSNIDEASFFGSTYILTGHEQVGPFEDTFALVKVHFKRGLKKKVNG